MCRLPLILVCLFGCVACNTSIKQPSPPFAVEIGRATLRADSAHFRFTSKDETGQVTIESEGAFSKTQNCGWSVVGSGSDALEFRTVQAVHYVGVTAAEAVDGVRWIRIDANALDQLLGRQISPELVNSIATGDVVPAITELTRTSRTNSAGEYKAQLDGQPGRVWLDARHRLMRYELHIGGRLVRAELSDFGSPVACDAPAESETVDYVQLIQAIQSQLER